jgi:hypothetical protein
LAQGKAMTTRGAKTGHWLVTVYWIGMAANMIAGAAMLGWLVLQLANSVHLSL